LTKCRSDLRVGNAIKKKERKKLGWIDWNVQYIALVLGSRGEGRRVVFEGEWKTVRDKEYR
jgi:hypothetical protein